MLQSLLRAGPAFLLFALAFFFSSWDFTASVDAGGFTFKLYQGFFLAGGITLAWRHLRAGAIDSYLAPLRQPFALAMLSLGLFSLGMAPWSAFPLKSFLYSCWLLFDVTALWLSVQLLFREVPEELFARVAFGTILFLSAVILIDYAAYPFGYRGGLIGHNQDIVLNLMISRPHAFSSEPSYAASYLCLGLFTTAPYWFRRARRRWLAMLGILLVGFAIVATTSRSGWASLAMGVALLVILPVLRGRRLPWKPVAAAAVAIPALVAIFLATTPKAQLENLHTSLISGLLHGNDSSGTSRMKALELAGQIARETHGVGSGIGASYRYFKEHNGFDYNFQEAFNQRMYGNEVIMSTWGQLLAEGGVVGTLLYLLAAILMLVSLWRAWAGTDSLLAYGSIAGAAVFFFFMAIWLGNVCRGDMWVWFALWSGFAGRAKKA